MRVNKIEPHKIHINRNVSEKACKKIAGMKRNLEILAEDYGYDMRFVEYNKALLVNFGPKTAVLHPESPEFNDSVYTFIHKAYKG